MSAYEKVCDQMVADGIDFIDSNISLGVYDEDTDFDDIYDDMFVSDDVCGNGYSGHTLLNDADYMELIFDDDIVNSLAMDFGITINDFCNHCFGHGNEGRKWIDCIIRCYFLDLGDVRPKLQDYWNERQDDMQQLTEGEDW